MITSSSPLVTKRHAHGRWQLYQRRTTKFGSQIQPRARSYIARSDNIWQEDEKLWQQLFADATRTQVWHGKPGESDEQSDDRTQTSTRCDWAQMR